MEPSQPPSILPRREAIRALREAPDDAPVVMLNLLKFKPGGEPAYQRYSAAFRELAKKHDVRVIYSGRAEQLLIGEDQWDMIALVEYPSRKVFLEMTRSPEYVQISADRTAGLERTVLYATRPSKGPESNS